MHDHRKQGTITEEHDTANVRRKHNRREGRGRRGYRECDAGDGVDGRERKEPRELPSVHCRRRDDQVEVLALADEAAQDPEQNVCVRQPADTRQQCCVNARHDSIVGRNSGVAFVHVKKSNVWAGVPAIHDTEDSMNRTRGH
eukprot:900669-Rhodomonas_salina.3